MTSPPTAADAIARSLAIAWREAIPAGVMVGVVDYYLVPLALFLGATTQQIGTLTSLPQLLTAGSLLFAAHAVRRVGSRRRFTVLGATLQAAALIPIGLLSLAQVPGRIGVLLVLVVAARVLGGVIAPAWGSLMSDYLPPDQRGGFLGSRSRVLGTATVVAMGLSGVTLAYTKHVHVPAWGFGLIFLVASLARFCSASSLARMTDLPVRDDAAEELTFWQFLRGFREHNVVRVAYFVAGIVFGAYLAAPYFSVYMLRDRHFSYLAYMAVHLAGMVSGVLASPIWGRHADVVGNARVLKTTGRLVPFLPLLWLVSSHPAYLVTTETLSGVVWGGFNLCATNFIYDAVPAHQRVRVLGYFNLLNGMAMFVGASLGGLLAEWIPPIGGFRLLTLMVLSGAMRGLVALLLAPRFHEVRTQRKRVSGWELMFSVVGLRPLLGEGQESLLTVFWRPGQAAHSPGPMPPSEKSDSAPQSR